MRWAKIEEVENGYLVTYANSWAAEEKQRVCKDIDEATEALKAIFKADKNPITKTPNI